MATTTKKISRTGSQPGAVKHHFDEAAADRVVQFFEKGLTHVKGDLANEPLLLDDWQINDIIRPLFGWKRADGTRSYRTAYIEVPRKNGKSTLCAGIALYGLFGDDEPGAECYSAAADRGQAGIVFKIARQMVNNRKELRKRCRIYHNSIARPDGSFYQSISADAHRQHGFNSHIVIFDELHAQKSRDLFDALDTSFGSRSNPLFIMITTAGWDRNSICYEMHQYALAVAEGKIEDDEFLSVIYSAQRTEEEEEKDPDFWQREETWKQANPGYGTSVKPDYMKGKAKRASNSAAYTNTFKRLHLNIWTSQLTRWLTDTAWANGGGPLTEEFDAECYGGLDLATSDDLAALSLYWPATGDVLWWFWIPEENVSHRSDRMDFTQWVKDGFITATPGDAVDFDYIMAKIIELNETYQIKELAYDRWGAVQLAMKLIGEGVEMVPHGQGYASMSAPSKELLRLLLEGEINHGDNPVARWMAGNVMVTQDAAGNIKPDKAKSSQKIDGIVSLIMSIGRASIHAGDKQFKSVYADDGRGMVTV